MLGAPGPFGYIDMGGMFTLLKVRDGITSYEDPGWYQNPEGTLAVSATSEEMKSDLGILSQQIKAQSAEAKDTDHKHHHH